MLRRLLTENVDLVIRTAPDIGFVKADPVQMEQVSDKSGGERSRRHAQGWAADD